MPPTKTSIRAFVKHDSFTVSESDIFGYVTKLGPISTIELVEYLDHNQPLDNAGGRLRERRIIGALSNLKKADEIVVSGHTVSQRTGEEVELYRVNPNAPVPKKTKLEVAREEIERLEILVKELNEQNEFLIGRVDYQAERIKDLLGVPRD